MNFPKEEDFEHGELHAECLRYPPRNPPPDGSSISQFDIRTASFDWCGEWQAKRVALPVVEAHQILELGIASEELGLSARSVNALMNPWFYWDGVNTVGELVQFSAGQLLKIKNFGAVSLHEVREALAKHGLKLKGD